MPQYSLQLRSSSSQRLATADSTPLDLSGNFTFEGWVLPSTISGDHFILNKGDTDTSIQSYSMWIDSAGKLIIRLSDDGSTSSGHQLIYESPSGSVVANKWQFVAVTFDISTETCVMYVDGKPLTPTKSGTGMGATIYNSINDLVVGARQQSGAYNSYFNGSIAYLRIFNDIRTASEIVTDAHAETISDANLVGEWGFQNLYTDGSGNSQTFIPIGSPVFGVGVPFEAPVGVESLYEVLNLASASSQKASITDASQTGLDITSDLTMEAWINMKSLPSSGNNMNILSKFQSSGDQRSYSLRVRNESGTQQLRLLINDDGTSGGSEDYTFAYTLPVGVWTHIAVTWDASASTAEIFINGISLGTQTGANTSIFNSSAPFEIGSVNSSDFLNAFIYQARVFNDIRTQAEIISDAWTANVSNANLVAEWELDGDYADTSGNSNTLTGSNTPTFHLWGSRLAGGLVSYWTLDEVSGTREDAHGINDLTDNNTVGSDTGKQSLAADFENSNSEYLSISDGSQSGLDLTGNLTISAWVKVESQPSSSAMTIIGKWGAGGSRSYLVRYEDTAGTKKIIFYRSNNGTAVSDQLEVLATLGTGVWHHLSITFDVSSGIGKIYLDGVSYSFTGTISSTFNSGQDFSLGANASGNYFDGLIDEVAIWNRNLHYGEILDLYNDGAAISYIGVTPVNVTIGETNMGALQVTRIDEEYAFIEDIYASSLKITGDLTLEAWIKLDTLPADGDALYPIISKALAPDDVSYGLFLFGLDEPSDFGTCYLAFLASSDGTDANVFLRAGLIPLSVGEWMHVAATYDASENRVNLYANGVQIFAGGDAFPGALFDGAADVEIGAATSFGGFFDGLIKDVRVWNKVRTDLEIVHSYNNKVDPASSNLQAFWQFVGNYVDSTSNFNNLSIDGTSIVSDSPYANFGMRMYQPFMEVLLPIDVTALAGVNTAVFTAQKASVILGRVVRPDEITMTMSIPAYALETSATIAMNTIIGNFTAQVTDITVVAHVTVLVAVKSMVASLPALAKVGSVWFLTPRSTNATWTSTSRNSN